MFNDHLSHSIQSSMRNKLNDDWMCLWETRKRKTNFFRFLSRGNDSDELSFFWADNWFHASKGSLSFQEIFECCEKIKWNWQIYVFLFDFRRKKEEALAIELVTFFITRVWLGWSFLGWINTECFLGWVFMTSNFLLCFYGSGSKGQRSKGQQVEWATGRKANAWKINEFSLFLIKKSKSFRNMGFSTCRTFNSLAFWSRTVFIFLTTVTFRTKPIKNRNHKREKQALTPGCDVE